MRSKTAILILLLATTSFSIITFPPKKTFLDQKGIAEKVNSVQNNWVAGHNSYFDGIDMEAIKGLMGALKTPKHLELPIKDIEPLKDIPDEFFSSEAWPNC